MKNENRYRTFDKKDSKTVLKCVQIKGPLIYMHIIQFKLIMYVKRGEKAQSGS